MEKKLTWDGIGNSVETLVQEVQTAEVLDG